MARNIFKLYSSQMMSRVGAALRNAVLEVNPPGTSTGERPPRLNSHRGTSVPLRAHMVRMLHSSPSRGLQIMYGSCPLSLPPHVAYSKVTHVLHRDPRPPLRDSYSLEDITMKLTRFTPQLLL